MPPSRLLVDFSVITLHAYGVEAYRYPFPGTGRVPIHGNQLPIGSAEQVHGIVLSLMHGYIQPLAYHLANSLHVTIPRSVIGIIIIIIIIGPYIIGVDFVVYLFLISQSLNPHI